MMDRTDRHFRSLLRRLTRETLLYTEMVTTGALLHGDRERHLDFDDEERPLALQLGGDDPRELTTCARLAAERGYDEINLNVGCPSDRVQKGHFGVCLMAEPRRVADAVAAMRDAVALPVSVKHRIGFDELDRYEDMARFVEIVAAAGCDRFTVHARKAWLSGLDPKENREAPPLRYAEVHRLKRDFPDLLVEVNGGVRSLAEVREHLRQVDGVMIGRAAYEEPFLLATVDRELFGSDAPTRSRRAVVQTFLPYVERRLREGVTLQHLTRHLLHLFTGRPGARAWRRALSERSHLPGAGIEVIAQALAGIPDEVLDEVPDERSPEPKTTAERAAPVVGSSHCPSASST
jgi:tRNA-dihydrouridine synthase A